MKINFTHKLAKKRSSAILKETARAVRNSRKDLGLTQKDISELLGCAVSTVSRFESGSGDITGEQLLRLQLLLGRIPW